MRPRYLPTSLAHTGPKRTHQDLRARPTGGVNDVCRPAITRASADPFGQRDNDPFGTADVGHAPDVLVVADAADQSVSVRGQAVDRRLQIGDLETNVARAQ